MYDLLIVAAGLFIIVGALVYGVVILAVLGYVTRALRRRFRRHK